MAKYIMETQISPQDRKHLQFIYKRLINQHQERPNVDYMRKFKEIIGTDKSPVILKRFHVVDGEDHDNVRCKHETLRQVYDYLKGEDKPTDVDIKDIHDDITIQAEQLYEAWDEGERPEDLQMF